MQANPNTSGEPAASATATYLSGTGDAIASESAERPRRPPTSVAVALLALSAVGTALVLHVTRNGIGLSTDSVWYIDGARSLLAGEGYYIRFGSTPGPIAHWPPGYSVLLAAAGLIGLEPLAAARAVGALLFGANILAAGWLVGRHSGAWGAAVVVALLTLVSKDLLEVHVWAWSEPLFLLLCLAAFHWLALYLERPASRARLVMAAVLVALATLTRFVGVTVIGTAGLALLLLSQAPWRRRLADALLFGAIAVSPLLLWLARNVRVAGSGAPRDINFHPLGLTHLRDAAVNISGWLVSLGVPARIGIALVLVVVGAVIFRIARQAGTLRALLNTHAGRVGATCLLFVAGYLAFVAFSISFVDVDVTFDDRMLTPPHLLLLAAAGIMIGGLRWRRSTLVLLALIPMVLLHAAHTANWARAAGNGLGYNAARWRNSELWSVLERLPPGTPLYSNMHDLIYVHTGRVTRGLPARVYGSGRLAVDDFPQRLAQLRIRLAADSGVLLYLRTTGRPYLPSLDELHAALTPADVETFRDFTMFRIPPDAAGDH